jgi:hypothetical protein
MKRTGAGERDPFSCSQRGFRLAEVQIVTPLR